MISLGLKSHIEDRTTHQNSPTHIARTHLLLRNTSLKTSNQNIESVVDGWQPGTNPRVDHSGHLEFCGSWGTGAMMVGFPLLIYYMWIGATFYKGHFPAPTSTQSFSSFCRHLAILVYEYAFPTLRAWKIYWSFFLIEASFYCFLPGVQGFGKPLDHEGGKQLKYHCSAVWSFYITILLTAGLHFTGLFKLYTIIDEFGPILSVAILSGFLVAIAAYISARCRDAQHRMTGYLVYDFFMGSELNPRIGPLDFKMFFMVRIPWFILFAISCATAAKQYELCGHVSAEVVFLVGAHFLYTNACAKGEECIMTTWLVSSFSNLPPSKGI
jgi:delta24(24(1))-sterol reductase